MPRRPSKKRQPQGVDRLAAAILAEAVGEPQELTPTGAKNPAAVASGRLGSLRGGKARAANLGRAKRKPIAKKAAAARRKKS